MKKIISFSFWGDDPKYLQGAVENARLAKEFYPDWECWFHVSGHCEETPVLEPYLQQIREVNELSRIISMEARGDWRGMFWRFLPVCQNKFDAVILRDTDSRLSEREALAVQEWLDSDKGFHIMRDHPYHGTQILGGMWGMKKDCLPIFRDLMSAWNQEDRWQTDQDFLKAVVYPRVVDDAMVHDEFFALESHRLPFPTERDGCNFVGQVFEADGSTPQDHIQPLAEYLMRRK